MLSVEQATATKTLPGWLSGVQSALESVASVVRPVNQAITAFNSGGASESKVVPASSPLIIRAPIGVTPAPKKGNAWLYLAIGGAALLILAKRILKK